MDFLIEELTKMVESEFNSDVFSREQLKELTIFKLNSILEFYNNFKK